MSRDYRINTSGLTEKQNALVKANLPSHDCELYIADDPTDLIAINCEAMIVNASVMEQDSADMIFDLYTQIDGCTDETVIDESARLMPSSPRERRCPARMAQW